MSMAEVMIAMLVLAMGSLAVLNLIGASAHSSFRNQQSQSVSDRLQEEIERIQHLPYDQIALTGLPASSASQSSPAWRVQGTSYAVNRNGTQAAPLVYNGSALDGGGTVCDANHDCGVVDPAPTRFTDGNVSGTIYRYIVWQNDPTCPDTSCPGSQDLKRIIVAIALDTTAAGGIHRYQEIQTQLSDPTATHGTTPMPPRTGCTGGSDCTGTTCVGSVCAGGTCTGSNCTFPTPWTFWLTDTSCNNTSRQALVGDHLVHSTDGSCPTGTKDSSNCGALGCPPGAPDLMVTNPPQLTTETPLYNYSTDLSPSHKGLLMPKPSSTLGNNCLTSSLFNLLPNLANDPDTTRMQTIHRWVSSPMGNGFNISLTGDATLDLWTKSVDGVAYSGNLCIYLFTRTPAPITGLPVDTPVTTIAGNTGAVAPLSCTGVVGAYQCSESTWPTGWTELHIPLKFNVGLSLGPTTQLGLALQVERAGTSGGGLNFLYDEPSFDSRLQMNSVTPALPF
jgi:hypothetical protein